MSGVGDALELVAAPIRRTSLHDEIVARLRTMILEGALAPGDTIPELKLCEELQISRTPLREALKVLAAEELVELLPNRGSVVRPIVPSEIEQVFEVMECLEGLVAQLLVERATPEQIVELRGMHNRLVAFKDSNDKSGYFEMNQAIHRRMAELSGNRVLAADYNGHANKIRRARYLANLSSSRWAESVYEHEAFTQALERRDKPEFVRLLQDHMRHTGAAVVAALNLMPAPAEPKRKRR